MINKKSLIKIVEEKVSWLDAISIGVDLLVQNNIATNQLTDEIIKSTNELGPYYILSPRFALAHTRPGDYNKEIGLSIVVFKNSVEFSSDEKHKVNLLFTLSAKDSNSHIEVLTKVAMLFNENKNIVDQALKCQNIDDVYELFKEIV